jgi:hypothetical protein
VTQQVHMEDGTELSLLDHLRDEHRKGTSGFTEQYLSKLHRKLHQRKREDEESTHSHPSDEEEDGREPDAVS